jgi:predicted transcriptional regulator
MTTRKPAPKTVPIGPIRIDAELSARLKKAAVADQRSVSAVIRIAIKKYLDQPDTTVPIK